MRVFEIFSSIQGETTRTGLPMLFIRTAGCNLRCRWCDTQYAYEGGTEYSVEDLVARVEASGLHHVTLTGGEPLLQPDAPELVRALIDRSLEVQVETGGSLDIGVIDPRARRIVDIKAPGSGIESPWNAVNSTRLTAHDEIKIVVVDEDDYRWSRRFLDRERLWDRCPILLSPAWGLCDPADLAGWILRDRLPVRLNLQIHKYIWHPDRRGV